MRTGDSETRAQQARPRLALLAVGTLLYALAGWVVLFAGDRGGVAAVIGALLLFIVGTAAAVAALIAPALFREPTLRPAARSAGWLGLVGLLLLSSSLTLAVAALLLGSELRGTATYGSDAAAFNHFNAELVLAGQNPYTADSRFWSAIRQFPASGATPLRAGRYMNSRFGPSLDQIVRDVRSELDHPATRGPEFDAASMHSYPDLSFLVYVPVVWAGMRSTALASLVFWALFLLACGWGAPRGARLPVALILLANTPLAIWSLLGAFEVAALLPVVLAWRTFERPWLSSLLLGLACAVKQIAWPLMPFFLILAWRRYGWRDAATRLGILLAAFALVNLPYMIASPAAWAGSLFLPVTLPIFPSGMGIVALSRVQLLPLWPPVVYALLEVAALAVLLVWYAIRGWHYAPALALFLGLLPIILAWHSLLSYVIATVSLAVAGAVPLLQRDAAREDELNGAARDAMIAPA